MKLTRAKLRQLIMEAAIQIEETMSPEQAAMMYPDTVDIGGSEDMGLGVDSPSFSEVEQEKSLAVLGKEVLKHLKVSQDSLRSAVAGVGEMASHEEAADSGLEPQMVNDHASLSFVLDQLESAIQAME
jgi:hypothetical protein